MKFTDGQINNVEVRDLKFYQDERGWLSEIFRHDELDKNLHPSMAYLSMTKPGVQRGPHAHRDQTDYFAFFFSRFKLVLWDNRPGSQTRGNTMTVIAGKENPKAVIIPPGVVHAYKNTGTEEGLVMNFPNRLFAGWEKKEPVDEIRYEDDPDTIFRVD